jgi:hypothetical protein
MRLRWHNQIQLFGRVVIRSTLRTAHTQLIYGDENSETELAIRPKPTKNHVTAEQISTNLECPKE